MDFKNCSLHALSEPGTFITETLNSFLEDLKTVSPESSTELPCFCSTKVPSGSVSVPAGGSGEPLQPSTASTPPSVSAGGSEESIQQSAVSTPLSLSAGSSGESVYLSSASAGGSGEFVWLSMASTLLPVLAGGSRESI